MTKQDRIDAPAPGGAAGIDADPGRPAETVTVCMCTYRREHLAETLKTVLAQEVPEGLSLTVVVADNDATPSAQPVVEAAAAATTIPVRYVHAPERNISIARNACLDAADGDWVAFIDDDELAPPHWLAALWQQAHAGGLDVVFGPAYARYPEGTPDWIRQDDHLTNHVPVHRGEVRTGQTSNVLMRWRGSPIREQRFRLENGRTGGEDVEFFFRLHRLGQRMGVTDRAAVHETPGLNRLTYGWLRRRRFVTGQFHGAYSGPVPRSWRHDGVLLVGAAAKAAYSFLRAGLALPVERHRNRWALRGWFHLGVCAAVLGIAQANQY
ncbi:MAG: glycosyltransferase [Pseudomonadota bacterium]